VAPELYSAVPGQERVIEQLRRAAAHPVHAYLFVGPPGTGKHEAALGFAASLLCPNGGDGTCRVCRQVLAGTYVDVAVVERLGPFITVDQAHEITRMASRTPTEGRRKVLVLVDFHLADKAAPALLKTIEEPPPSTVFIILADHVPPELVTIASRCVRIDFLPLTEENIIETLEAEGIGSDAAAEAARAAGGRMDRARILASDPEVVARRSAWESVPARRWPPSSTSCSISSPGAEPLDSPSVRMPSWPPWGSGSGSRVSGARAARSWRPATSGSSAVGASTNCAGASPFSPPPIGIGLPGPPRRGPRPTR